MVTAFIGAKKESFFVMDFCGLLTGWPLMGPLYCFLCGGQEELALFAGSPSGAQASAVLYSLVETAKANGLEPYRYLRFLFERLPYAKTFDDYRNLAPLHLDRKEFDALPQWG